MQRDFDFNLIDLAAKLAVSQSYTIFMSNERKYLSLQIQDVT